MSTILSIQPLETIIYIKLYLGEREGIMRELGQEKKFENALIYVGLTEGIF